MKDYLCEQPVNEEILTLVADGAYGGELNISHAMKRQIKLITTNFTGRKPDGIYAEFRFNEDRTLLEQYINWKKQTRLYFGFKIAALNFHGTNQNQIH